MSRDRHSRRHGNNWRGGQRRDRDDFNSVPAKSTFRPPRSVTPEQIREDENAIREFKSSNQPVCPKCGFAIGDLTSALPDRTTGEPIHFDCALDELMQTEKLAPGEKIAYIGQGRFGVLNRPNPHDVKHFTITRIIEWEYKDSKGPWRSELAELFSHVR